MVNASPESVATAHGERFHALMKAIVRRLPFGLSHIVPASLLGFGIINGFTFLVDLALLTALHGGLGWSLPLSVTLAYAVAFGLSFVLNRAFNFRSHAPMGPQALTYVVVVIVNYLLWILGVVSGLVALGVEYHLARMVAGGCEGVYMYCAMRWIVFRDVREEEVLPLPDKQPD
jgi:putative flippase GtrA